MGRAGDTVSPDGLPGTVPLRLAAPLPRPAVRAAAGHDLAAPARRLPLAGGAGRLVLTAGLPAADLLALAVAAALAGAWLLPAAGYAGCVLVILAATGQHRLKITPRVSDQAGMIFVAALTALLATLPVAPAGLAVRLALLSAGLVTAARAAGYAGLRAARRRGRLTEPALVVGAGQVGAELAGQLARHPDLGLRPAGFLDSRPPVAGQRLPVLGRPAELARVVREHRIRRVIVAFPAVRDTDLVPAVRAARQLPADVCVVPRLHELGIRVPRATADEVWGIPLIPLRRPGRAAWLGKRAFDVLAAAILLLLLAPVLAVLGGLTRLQLRPVLFRQARITGTGRMAEIVKLRTLSRSGDPDTCWTAAPQRATRFGRLLRATHADELPQLVNVLRGEMSLVGPRPERPHFARRFEREIPRYGDRHRVPAGVTGWAQVHGLVGDTSISDRARFDNAYIENWTFWLDLVILARTVAAATAGLFTRRPHRRARQGFSAADHPALPDSTLGGQK